MMLLYLGTTSFPPVLVRELENHNEAFHDGGGNRGWVWRRRPATTREVRIALCVLGLRVVGHCWLHEFKRRKNITRGTRLDCYVVLGSGAAWHV